MFAERADAVITRVSGQDKGSPLQQQHMQVKSSGGETSASGPSGPEPMELGVARRRTLSRDEYQKLRAENACFHCRKPNAGHVTCDCPLKKKKKSGNAASH